MAHVYKAEDRQGRFGIVALKIMREEIASGREYQLRFRREAKIWANLDHPNIVPLLDYSNNDGQPYVAMRYIDGCSLHDFLADRGYLPVDAAIPIMKDILSAVAYAHKKKVIHRDIKPDNVLLDSHKRAFLTDFGIAKPVGATQLTNTGARLGTPTYMAPEQIRGKKNISARADIYALGVMFYEILTGRPPFQSDDPMVLSHAHCYEEPPELKRRGAPFPEELQTMIAKCLEKDVKKRPRSVSSMIKVLDRVALARNKNKSSIDDTQLSLLSALDKRKAHTEVTEVEPLSPSEAVLQKNVGARRQKKEDREREIKLPPEISYHSSIVNNKPPVPLAAFTRVGGFIVAAGLLVGLATTSDLSEKCKAAVEYIKSGINSITNSGVHETAANILEKETTRSALMMFEFMIADKPSCSPLLIDPIKTAITKAISEGKSERARLLTEYCIKLEPKNPEHRLLLSKVFFGRNMNLKAGREYIKALDHIPDSKLLNHLDESQDLIKKLEQREKRIVASRYYLAARGLLVAGRADLAIPYARAAHDIEPWNQVYKQILKPVSPVSNRRLR